jgi:hypothetical protein
MQKGIKKAVSNISDSDKPSMPKDRLRLKEYCNQSMLLKN